MQNDINVNGDLNANDASANGMGSAQLDEEARTVAADLGGAASHEESHAALDAGASASGSGASASGGAAVEGADDAGSIDVDASASREDQQAGASVTVDGEARHVVTDDLPEAPELPELGEVEAPAATVPEVSDAQATVDATVTTAVEAAAGSGDLPVPDLPDAPGLPGFELPEVELPDGLDVPDAHDLGMVEGGLAEVDAYDMADLDEFDVADLMPL